MVGFPQERGARRSCAGTSWHKYIYQTSWSQAFNLVPYRVVWESEGHKNSFQMEKKKKSVNVVVLRTVSFARFEVKDVCVHVSVCADF